MKIDVILKMFQRFHFYIENKSAFNNNSAFYIIINFAFSYSINDIIDDSINNLK